MVSGLRVRRLHPHLPVFSIEDAHERAMLHVPGSVVPADLPTVEALAVHWSTPPSGGRPLARKTAALAEELRLAAGEVRDRWERLAARPYLPVALTVELRGPCLLACDYCYAGSPLRAKAAPLNRAVLQAACDWVAGNCAAGGGRFVLSIHGVGESARTWTEARHCLEAARAAATRRAVALYAHATTHGQLDEGQAGWLADNFDAIDLSCDGLPEVQNAARPRRDHAPSSRSVESVARFWTARGVNLSMRATVTPRTLLQMRRLVEYAAALGIRRLRLEPAYGMKSGEFRPEQAGLFVHELIETQRLGTRRGIEVETSTPRLDELHGPFCEVNRQVLRLLDDGRVTGCLRGRYEQNDGAPGNRMMQAVPAAYDLRAGRFHPAAEVVARFQKQFLTVPDACRNCLIQFNCARSCPDGCPSPQTDYRGTFRCRVQQQLALQWIWHAAGPGAGKSGVVTPPGAYPEPAAMKTRLQEMLAPLAGRVAGEGIVNNVVTAGAIYPIEDRDLPAPPWVDHGFDQDGEKAWETLRAAAREHPGTPVSIYLHVPFCEQKCLFCDCHSLRIPRTAARKRGEFVQRLLADIRQWGTATPAERWPVTTVHFGGGTPTCLDDGELDAIVAALTRHFGVDARTEWAVETTETGLDNAALGHLRRCGFTRLHVGVQTLEEPLRQQLGRRVTTRDLLPQLQAAMAAGFTTSVDLIYGLPEQTLPGWLDTIEQLAGIGIHGLSTYALNLSERNRQLLRKFPHFRRDDLRDCLMLNLAEEVLLKRGYQKNHFAHFARPEDRNLYFRHATRGEPLIALGPSASGNIGGVDYRMCNYPRYLAGTRVRPALEGSLRVAEEEAVLQPIMAGVMAGHAQRAAFGRCGAEPLIDRWIQHRLLSPGSGAEGNHRLTAMGSWLVARMLQEILALQ